uniref:mRNA n=1 Tax=Arundo donax TaxID=35708 RepID=A0A0A9GE04_ARUDO
MEWNNPFWAINCILQVKLVLDAKRSRCGEFLFSVLFTKANPVNTVPKFQSFSFSKPFDNDISIRHRPNKNAARTKQCRHICQGLSSACLS